MIAIAFGLGVGFFAMVIVALLLGQRARQWKSEADYRLELAEHHRSRRIEVEGERDAWLAFSEENVMRGTNRSCVACGKRAHLDDCMFVALKSGLMP